jgi:hypothetical protein
VARPHVLLDHPVWFKGDYSSHLLTALSYPFSLIFEWKAWRRPRPRIMASEFDVVLRLLPVVPTLPSHFELFFGEVLFHSHQKLAAKLH